MAISLEELVAGERLRLVDSNPLSFLPGYEPNRPPLHILSVDQFSRRFIEEFFRYVLMHVKPTVEHSRRHHRLGTTHSDKLAFLIFEEPSTRTRMSFGAAALLTGHRVDSVQGVQFSSRAKGESVRDMFRALGCYVPDVTVYRSHSAQAMAEAAAASIVPVINAGNGDDEHPTQALLDLFTLLLETGSLRYKKVALIGDLWNGRTVRSLAKALSLFEGNEFYFVSPEPFRMRDDIKRLLTARGCAWHETTDLASVLPDMDACYPVRMQGERFKRISEEELARDPQKGTQREYLEANPTAFRHYQIGLPQVALMRPNCAILHPLPRNEELLTEVDDTPNAAYIRQMYLGLLIRSGLFDLVHGDTPQVAELLRAP